MYKKILAGVLTATMVTGSSFMAFAAQSGSTSGVGSLDIVEKSDVFNVVLPTVPADGDTRFDYILDPTSVINDTDAAKYNGATFATGKTVYFKNAPTTDGGTASYSEKSDTLTITNKGTVDVDVTVNASVKTVTGITMAAAGTFTDTTDKTASLYLALTDGTNTNAITSSGGTLTNTLAGSPSAYEPKFVDGKYVMVEKENSGVTFNTFSFGLTGACNPNGVWTGLTDKPPVVDLVWTVTDSTVNTTVALAATGEVTISNLTKDVNIVSASTDITLGVGGAMYPVDDNAVTWDATQWTAENGGTLKFTLKDAYKEAYNGKKVTIAVKLTNGSTISCVSDLNMQ